MSARGGLHRGLRVGVFALAAASSSLLVTFVAFRALAVWAPERAALSLDLVRQVDEVRRVFRRRGGGERVLLLGDSVIGQGEGLPPRLAIPAALRESGGRAASARVEPLWRLGFSVAAEYLLADDLVALGADRVVLEVNLRLLAAACGGCSHHPELAGHVRPARFPEAFGLPLDVAGVTANRLVFYRLLVTGGMEPRWASLMDVQARFYNLRDKVELSLEKRVGVSTVAQRRVAAYFTVMGQLNMSDKHREPLSHILGSPWAVREGVDETYPPLELLGSVVRKFARAKQRPLVWIAPVNVDHLRSLGLGVTGFDATAAAIRSVVEQNGGSLVDLHAALRDAEFADAFDHPTTEGDGAGSKILARQIVASMLAAEKAEKRRAVQ